MTQSDYKFFKKARQAALISDYKKIHIGCIAVYQGNIIVTKHIQLKKYIIDIVYHLNQCYLNCTQKSIV